MKILEEDERDAVADLVDNFRRLHDKSSQIQAAITEMTEKITSMQNELKLVTNALTMNRAADNILIGILSNKYGPGKLDVQNMTWKPKSVETAIDDLQKIGENSAINKVATFLPKDQ